VLRSVAAKTIRDARRGLVWWSLGIAALVVLQNAFYPSIKDDPSYNQLAEDLPEVAKAFFGEDFTSPAGYLQSQLFSLMIPLLLLLYGIAAGARAVAGEEEGGTLDLLLAQPVSRTRVVLEKAAAIALLLAVLALAVFASVWLPASVFELDIGAGDVAAAVVAQYLLALAFAFIALLAGAATGSRSAALGIAAVLAVGAYLLDGLAQVVDALDSWRVLSPFELVGDPLREGLGWGLLALAAIALVALAAAPPLFGRRDVAT
jgi:ABC-2 type transport system permease protein